MKPYLKDDLVVLRAIEPEDINLLFEWENDEAIWTVSHTIAPFSRHTLSLYLQDAGKSIYESGQLRLMIDTPQGETIGAIDLFDFNPMHARVGMGILIHNTVNRGKGSATAALNLMIRYCFEKLNLHQIYVNILTDNDISLKLFSKAGFVLAGTKREWIREGETWKDEYLLQLLKKERNLQYWG